MAEQYQPRFGSVQRFHQAVQQFMIHWLLLPLLRGYQLVISPLLGPNCRFYPTCSHYTKDALIQHGLWRGSWLAITRISKCHPWHPGGHDPVPPSQQHQR